jgi:alkanesulfonate monooxygenase SsuD/methylene tetrahydromethanopterin reductase-like flavin-dependent oxidoreductase (luciferase family)
VEVGIGLPNVVPGTSGRQLVDFAREAEAQGFSSLGTIDRIVYPNYDPFVALAAAAAVTERIRLATTILIVPYRINAALVAKQASSLQALSGGRLVLGVAIGGREDDYEASGLSAEGRGETIDSMLEEMKRVWDGEERGYAGAIGPQTDPPPQLIVGGTVDASFHRAARFGAGWIMGGGAPDQFAEAAAKVRDAWSAAGREEDPRLMSLAYFSLGPDAERRAEQYIRSYYGYLGETADAIAASAATDVDTVREYLSAFEDAGCDELIFFPCSSDPEQASLLAQAVGERHDAHRGGVRLGFVPRRRGG